MRRKDVNARAAAEDIAGGLVTLVRATVSLTEEHSRSAYFQEAEERLANGIEMALHWLGQEGA